MAVESAAWRVQGIVQGVGFRYFTYRNAHILGLCGWVRNLPDGSVEVAVRGDSTGIAQLLDILKIGPRSGRVDAIHPLPPSPALEDASDFAIK